MTDVAIVPRRISGRRLALAYAALLAGSAGLFFLVVSWSEGLTAPTSSEAVAAAREATGRPETLPRVLLALVVIIAAARAVGWLFARLHQPPVIGEVIAGILLGPSFLGTVGPGVAGFLFPASITGFINVIAQLGVILYLFLVGLELNPDVLGQLGREVMAIAHASMLVPFLLGAGLALFLYPRLSSSDVRFTVFALFLGVAMAITAFPVLARILTDRGMAKTPLGVLSLTCAAIGDVTAWCVLAFVVGVAAGTLSSAVSVMAGTAAYVAFMLLAVRPLLRRWAYALGEEGLSQGVVALLFVGLLLSAWATEAIGIHALFGAFLMGAVIPSDSVIARRMTERLHDVVAVLFLPAYFAFTGMRTEIGLVWGIGPWLICGLIVVTATLGKFGSTLGAARLTGVGWRDAAALGVLMNTRGLMKLVVLNIGLDLRVISPTLYAMMMLMALVTTMATTPVLQWLVARPAKEEGLV